MANVSDSMTRADSGTLGANWTNQLNGLQIVNNAAVGTANAVNNTAYWSADAFQDDQFSQATISSTFGGSLFVGLSVRSAGTGDCYVLEVSPALGTYLVKIASGSASVLTNNATTWAAGDVMKLEMIGTTLTAYKNGASVLSTTDATLASGAPGIWTFTSSAGVTTWSGGPIAASSGSPISEDYYMSPSGLLLRDERIVTVFS